MGKPSNVISELDGADLLARRERGLDDKQVDERGGAHVVELGSLLLLGRSMIERGGGVESAPSLKAAAKSGDERRMQASLETSGASQPLT